MTETTKVTVNLPSEVVEELKEIAKLKNITLTDAIRQSIQINKFLLDQEKASAKLLLETPDGKIERIVRK